MTASRPSSHPVHVGLKFSQQLCTIEQQREVWRIADEAGFDHLWDFDHFHPIGSAPLDGDIFEGWALLAAMAEATKRVRIGNMVTGNTYRHPAVLAKIATTVDHLSGGRLEFGLGGAWAEAEHTMLGLDFPRVGERLRRLGEACQVVKKLWTEEKADFDGRYYRLEGAFANPKPVQKPYPPIWIGGAGPQRTLKIVARHGDVWNSNAGEMEKTIALSKILDEHCAVVGRDPNAVRRSVQLRLSTVEESLRTAERYLNAGFTEQIIMLGGPDPAKNAELAANELLPRMRTLG
jgi:F420-dependent oxidoreductase-like protein